jgi:hypothetical protein
MAQHDYNLANQSGLAFRQDLNNALAAIVSQNSGASEPSTTYAYQWWADTTTGLLKLRNAANSAWITIGTLASANLGLLSLAGGTLTGALLADDGGTAALPAVAFDGDSDTGIYRKAANELGVATGGVLRGWFDSAGVNLAAQGDTRYWDSDSTHYVAFQAPATVASNITWTLPSGDGTAGQSLTTNGSGVLSFSSAVPFATTSEVNGTHTTGTVTSGTTSLTVASATGIVAGMFVVGEGITPGTTVSSIASTTVTLSANAGATLSSAPVSFYIATKALTPGLVAGQLCRAWVNFNGTGTVAIRASYNVSSITDNGAGSYTVNFTTAMVDSNYAAIAGVQTPAGYNTVGTTLSNVNSSSLSLGVVGIIGTNNVAADPVQANVTIFR